MEEKEMSSDRIAELLVELYASYKSYAGETNENYAKAVAIAIRMLSD